MTYKIGTRVKKVRGHRNLGVTGIVCQGPTSNGQTFAHSKRGSDMYVKLDCDAVTPGGRILDAGCVGMGKSENWEPILDRHEPCESEFKESLDHLLSRLKGVEA